jgi:hypothetical protein
MSNNKKNKETLSMPLDPIATEEMRKIWESNISLAEKVKLTHEYFDKQATSSNKEKINTMKNLEIVKEVAKGYNKLDSAIIEAIASNEIIYESQWVINSINGSKEVFSYLAHKFEIIKKSATEIHAELAYFGEEPCIVLAQNSKENPVATIRIKIENNKITRIDICQIPHWNDTVRTNEYPN